MNVKCSNSTSQKSAKSIAKKIKIVLAAFVALCSFIIVMLSLGFCDSAFFNKQIKQNTGAQLTVPKFLLPSGVDGTKVGLFSVSAAEGNVVFSQADKIDNNMPLVFLLNDISITQSNYNIISNWQNGGYNVIAFQHSAAGLTDSYAYANMFLHYYISFINNIGDFRGSEIRFVGSADAAEIGLYATSQIIAREETNAEFITALPDRLAILDINNSEAPALAEAPKTIANRGIAQETIINVTNLQAMLPANDLKIMLYKYTTVLEYRTDWVKIEESAESLSLEWYSSSLNHKLITDTSISDSEEYVPTAKLPISYILARRGALYIMPEKNMTKSLNDDKIVSVGVSSPVIAGVAFYDNNNNGINDQRIVSRAETVKIEIYLINGNSYKMLSSHMTTKGGYYRVEIPPIYANRFDVLFVKCGLNKGLLISERSDAFLMGNDINASVQKSDGFTFNHRRNITIKNIGVINNK